MPRYMEFHAFFLLHLNYPLLCACWVQVTMEYHGLERIMSLPGYKSPWTRKVCATWIQVTVESKWLERTVSGSLWHSHHLRSTEKWTAKGQDFTKSIMCAHNGAKVSVAVAVLRGTHYIKQHCGILTSTLVEISECLDLIGCLWSYLFTNARSMA